MHLIISIIIGGLFLILLVRAIFETIIGLCQILFGIVMILISYSLHVIAWCMRIFSSLWRTAMG